MGDEARAGSSMDTTAIVPEHPQGDHSLDIIYDIMLRQNLQWPSMTVQWLPEVTMSQNKNLALHRLILGTKAGLGDNYLIIATIALPRKPSLSVSPPPYVPFVNQNMHGERDGVGPFPPPAFFGQTAASGLCPDLGQFEIERRIVHQGPVLRARSMPQQPSLIATRSLDHDVRVYDYLKYGNYKVSQSEFKPELRLKGHKNVGKSLSWSPNRSGFLLSASEDHTVRLWDVNTPPKEHRVINARCIYTGHAAEVRDVAWHRSDFNVFGSVSDDKRAMIWDIRVEPNDRPMVAVEAHASAVNCISFNNFNEHNFLTSGADFTIALWDLRGISKPIQRFTVPQGAVTQLEWSPNNETVFASAGTDRNVNIWKFIRSGGEVSLCAEFTPDHIFTHGHVTNVADFSWNPIEPWLICSVAEDHNQLQVWEMSDKAPKYW